VAYLKAISRHSSRGTEANHVKQSQEGLCPRGDKVSESQFRIPVSDQLMINVSMVVP
jgi:hypothetical protein